MMCESKGDDVLKDDTKGGTGRAGVSQGVQ